MNFSDYRYSRSIEKKLQEVEKHLSNSGDAKVDAVHNRQRLFAIRHRANPEAIPDIVNGTVVKSKVIDDLYDITFLGLTKDFVPLGVTPKTRAQKEFRTLYRALIDEQVVAVREGKIRKREEMGMYVDEADLPDLPEEESEEQ